MSQETRSGDAVTGDDLATRVERSTGPVTRRTMFRFAAQLAPSLLVVNRGDGFALLPRSPSSDTRRMVRFPEKRELILLTDRAPQLETPRFEPVSVIAIAQCSGNSRSLFEPRVAGSQWRHGGMGAVDRNPVTRFAGRRRHPCGSESTSLSTGWLDEPPLASIPDVEKSLGVDRAREPDVMVAYEMNGSQAPTRA